MRCCRLLRVRLRARREAARPVWRPPRVRACVEGMAEPSVAAEVGLLFRTKRVTEIRAVEASVRSDAEERAANLRQLLGTRYRDLLGAADAIGAARDAAQTGARDALARVAADASGLRAAFLKAGRAAGASPRGGDAAGDLHERRDVSAIGGRLLCIVDSPEVLYACLEGGDVFEGALRFAAAERAFAALDPAVVSAFVRGRWERVDAFRPQILTAARARIASTGASLEEVAGCFIADVVLGAGKCEAGGAAAALDRLLEARTAWIGEIFARDDQTAAGKGCVRVAEVVRDTIVCCQRLFAGEGPLVEKMLGALGDEGAGKELVGLREDGTAAAKIAAWMTTVEASVRDCGGVLMTNAGSVKELAATLAAVEAVFEGDKWAAGCAHLSVAPERGVAMLGPVVCERAKVVVGLNVRGAVDAAVKGVDAGFAAVSPEKDSVDERWENVAVHAMRWTGTARSANGRDSAADGGEEFAPAESASSIARYMESALGSSIADARLLGGRMPDVFEELRKAAEKSIPEVASCLSKKASLLLEETRQSMERARNKGPGEETHELGDASAAHSRSVARALFIARTATSITAGKHVSAAFSAGTGADEGPTKEGYTPALSKFHATASEASSRAYEAWAAQICLVLEAQLRLDFRALFSLDSRSPWDGAGKNGATDGIKATGDLHESPHCPTAASPGAFRFALSACQAANAAGGFSLPSGAISALTEAMRAVAPPAFDEACQVYDKRCDARAKSRMNSNAPERPENVNMQLFFDARFLAGFLLGKTNDKTQKRSASTDSTPSIVSGGEEFKSMIARMRARIDPINMVSLAKVMDESVDSYIARSSVLLGTLARSIGGDAIMARRAMAVSNTYASAGVLALAPPVTRFAYLPAPMPSTYSGRNSLSVGLSSKANIDLFRDEAASAESKRDAESTVVDYASKLSENVGRFGRGFIDSWRGSVGQ